jgi:hypothetical protein
MNREICAIVASVVLTTAAAGMLLRRTVATPVSAPAPTPPHLRLITPHTSDVRHGDSGRVAHR